MGSEKKEGLHLPGLYLDHKLSDPEKKPDDKLYGWKFAERPPEAWVTALTKGFTIVPGMFVKDDEGKYRHKEEFWKHTRIICADADNIIGEKGELPEHNAIEPWTEENGLLERYPTLKDRAFAITQSVSSMVEKQWTTKGEHFTAAPCRRHRVVFVFEEDISDGEQYRKVLLALAEEFPIIAPVERQPGQPVFGNCREGFNEAVVFGNVIAVPEVGIQKKLPQEESKKERKTALPKGSNYLRDWLEQNDIDYTETKDQNKFQVDCPWGDEHSNGVCRRQDAFVKEVDGKWFFHCSHATCKANGRNLRQFAEKLGLDIPNERLNGHPYFSGGTYDPGLLISDLLHERKIFTESTDAQDAKKNLIWLDHKDSQTYYEGGAETQAIIQDMLADRVTDTRVNETMATIKRRQDLYVDKFPDNRDLIATRNAVYDLGQCSDENPFGVVVENAEDLYLKNFFDFTVNPQPTNVDRFIEVVVDITSSADGAERPKASSCFYEFVGSILHKNCTDMKKGLLCAGTGAGNNGKSMLINSVVEMVGTFFTVGLNLGRLSDEQLRFEEAKLINKQLVYCADIGTRAMSEALKGFIAGDPLNAEIKGQSKMISFRPHATFIGGSNGLPKVRGGSKALYDRWIVLPLEREFEIDPKFATDFQKYCIENKDDILSWCLFRYAIAYRRLEYTVPETMAEVMEDWREDQDVSYAFVKECIGEAEEANLTHNEIKDEYVAWCEASDVPEKYRPSRNAVFKTVREVFSVRKQTIRRDDKTYAGYNGIAFI